MVRAGEEGEVVGMVELTLNGWRLFMLLRNKGMPQRKRIAVVFAMAGLVLMCDGKNLG